MKKLNEYINESMVIDILNGMGDYIFVLLAVVLSSIAAVSAQVIMKVFGKIKELADNKKLAVICKKLSNDNEVKTFLANAKIEEIGKNKTWSDMLASKLSDKELKTIKTVCDEEIGESLNESKTADFFLTIEEAIKDIKNITEADVDNIIKTVKAQYNFDLTKEEAQILANTVAKDHE